MERLDTIAEVVDSTPTNNTEKQPMSVQCPHCGGDFNLEVKLTVPVLPECKPHPVMPAKTPTVSAPKFAAHTDAGKFRQALHDADYPEGAEYGTIWNDLRNHGTGRRLKVSLTSRAGRGRGVDGIGDAGLDETLLAQFGDRLIKHEQYGTYGYVVYLNG